MNDLGLIEALKNNLFPGGIGSTGTAGLNGYYDIIWPYLAMFAGILTIILVGVQVATAFANPSKELDPYILIKPILILAAMSFYGPLVSLLLDKPTDLLKSVTEQTALQITGAFSMSQDAGGGSGTGAEIENDQTFESFFLTQLIGKKDKPGEEMEDIYDWIYMNPVLEIIHLFIQILAITVSLYIMIRQVLLLGVYYVIGIFVLPFSLIPGNQEIIKKWFFGFLAVFLWIPVLRILQTIIIVVDIEAIKAGSEGVAALSSIVLQFCAVFFILMTPKFANMLVSGSGDNDSSGWLMFIGRESYYYARGVGAGSRMRRSGK